MLKDVLAIVFSNARDSIHVGTSLLECSEPIDPNKVRREGLSIREYFAKSNKLTVEDFGIAFPDCLRIIDDAWPHTWENEYLFDYLTLPESDEDLQKLSDLVGLAVVAFMSPGRHTPYKEIFRVSS